MPRHFALLPAAGSGSRMGAACPKQYLDLLGHPLIWHSIQVFQRAQAIAHTYVVLAPDDQRWSGYDWGDCPRLTVLPVGGTTRAASVLNGLEAMAGAVADDDWVLVHDAARPCLNAHLLERLMQGLAEDPVGGILAAPIADTLKRADDLGRVSATVPREQLWGAQTPQMFRYALLRRALQFAGSAVTDEASAIEALGLSPKLVESERRNLKVTYADDLDVAAWWLGR